MFVKENGACGEGFDLTSRWGELREVIVTVLLNVLTSQLRYLTRTSSCVEEIHGTQRRARSSTVSGRSYPKAAHRIISASCDVKALFSRSVNLRGTLILISIKGLALTNFSPSDHVNTVFSAVLHTVAIV